MRFEPQIYIDFYVQGNKTAPKLNFTYNSIGFNSKLLEDLIFYSSDPNGAQPEC